MEFINVEEFQSQPKDIQEVFMEWWKPERLDIFVNHHCTHMTGKYEDDDIKPIYVSDIWVDKNECIPLFTEGQLRNFIEDKANGVIKVIQWHVEDNEISKRGYSIDILRKKEYHVLYHYKNLGDDLLQAYWKVALKVAKESVENEYK